MASTAINSISSNWAVGIASTNSLVAFTGKTDWSDWSFKTSCNHFNFTTYSYSHYNSTADTRVTAGISTADYWGCNCFACSCSGYSCSDCSCSGYSCSSYSCSGYNCSTLAENRSFTTTSASTFEAFTTTNESVSVTEHVAATSATVTSTTVVKVIAASACSFKEIESTTWVRFIDVSTMEMAGIVVGIEVFSWDRLVLVLGIGIVIVVGRN